MVDLKRLEQLQEICHKCKQPKRYPGCECHCETGIERVALNEQKRQEEYERKKAGYEQRTYIHDALEKGKKKRGKI